MTRIETDRRRRQGAPPRSAVAKGALRELGDYPAQADQTELAAWVVERLPVHGGIAPVVEVPDSPGHAPNHMVCKQQRAPCK